MIGLQRVGLDEQLHAQVAPDRRLALRLGEPALCVDEIGLDTVEVVFGLSIDHAEHGIGIRLALHMGNAKSVAGDADPGRLRPPARHAGLVGGKHRSGGQEQGGDEDFLHRLKLSVGGRFDKPQSICGAAFRLNTATRLAAAATPRYQPTGASPPRSASAWAMIGASPPPRMPPMLKAIDAPV